MYLYRCRLFEIVDNHSHKNKKNKSSDKVEFETNNKYSRNTCTISYPRNICQFQIFVNSILVHV